MLASDQIASRSADSALTIVAIDTPIQAHVPDHHRTLAKRSEVAVIVDLKPSFHVRCIHMPNGLCGTRPGGTFAGPGRERRSASRIISIGELMSRKILLLWLALPVLAQSTPPTAAGLTPLEVVNLRMQRYNERQVDALLQLYADDIAVYEYPDRLQGKGKTHLRRVLEHVFKDSTDVTISHQLESGRQVINEENVSYSGKARRYISIYEVRDGLIRSVRFIRE